MANRVRWSRDELLVTFRLYCRTPFGRLHQHNPEIVELAGLLGRTPSAVGMKACNFASLDPVQRARNIAALANVSRADRELWQEFAENAEGVAAEAEEAFSRIRGADVEIPAHVALAIPDGPTEIDRTVRTRRVQAFFRAAVLASYEYRCALSDVSIPELLNASHIIPWKINTCRRADPRNGLALNALYDRAFDRGLITFDESLRLVLSDRLRLADSPLFHRHALLEMEGRKLRCASRFQLDPAAMAYHREHVFNSA
jgi:putative restriction endonuclease